MRSDCVSGEPISSPLVDTLTGSEIPVPGVCGGERPGCLVHAGIERHSVRMVEDLRLFTTEAAAKKAGLRLASYEGERLTTTLYALLPADINKPTYLLSRAYRLTVAEQRWVMEHAATVTKLGRFRSGGSYIPLQKTMVRAPRTG